jgi:cysteine desulfurase
MTPIYLDHNATTPLDPEVLEAMRPHWLLGGNPESRHSAGRGARRALEQSRESVARILGAAPDEVVFTSGGTEANNLAVFGLSVGSAIADLLASRPEMRSAIADPTRAGTPHLVSSPIEHPAVAEPVARLEAAGFAVDRSGVDAEGRADARAMAGLIRPSTRLATLMLANNETGALQPVAELAALASQAGVPVHTDAVQAVGRIAVDFHALGVSTLASSAHKFHGPAGIGLLLVRKGVKLTPRTFGGGQQGGRRPGTPTVALAVGMAKALELWQDEANRRDARWSRLVDRLESGLLAALGPERVVRNGPSDPKLRLPQTLNVGFPGLDGDALLMQLDLAGVAASLGSACASGASTPSTTLLAMRVPENRLRSSVRFSLGASTDEAEIDEALARVVAVVERISGAEGAAFEGLGSPFR